MDVAPAPVRSGAGPLVEVFPRLPDYWRVLCRRRVGFGEFAHRELPNPLRERLWAERGLPLYLGE